MSRRRRGFPHRCRPSLRSDPERQCISPPAVDVPTCSDRLDIRPHTSGTWTLCTPRCTSTVLQHCEAAEAWRRCQVPFFPIADRSGLRRLARSGRRGRRASRGAPWCRATSPSSHGHVRSNRDLEGSSASPSRQYCRVQQPNRDRPPRAIRKSARGRPRLRRPASHALRSIDHWARDRKGSRPRQSAGRMSS